MFLLNQYEIASQSCSIVRRSINRIIEKLFFLLKMIRNKEDLSVETIVKFAFNFLVFTTFSIPLTIIKVSNSFFHEKKELNGKLVMIVSNGNQLNRSLALHLASLGCDIALVDASKDFTKKIILEINSSRKSLAKAYTEYDISQRDDITRLFDIVTRDFGHVDILINNADYTDEKNIDEMIHLNVHGTIMVIEQYLENLKFSNREGHVVTVSSILGLFPSTNSVTYGCTKAATISYMNGLNEKIRREPTMCDRIKTTCICLPLADLKNLKPDESEVIETVSTITNAIIDEKSFVSQPSYLYKLTQGLTLLPLHIQQLARDLFLRETF